MSDVRIPFDRELRGLRRGAMRYRETVRGRYRAIEASPPRHLEPGSSDRSITVALFLAVNTKTLGWPTIVPAENATGNARYTVPTASVFVVVSAAMCAWPVCSPYSATLALGSAGVLAESPGVASTTAGASLLEFPQHVSTALSDPSPLPKPVSVYGGGVIALGLRRWYTAGAAGINGDQYEPRAYARAVLRGYLTPADGVVLP